VRPDHAFCFVGVVRKPSKASCRHLRVQCCAAEARSGGFVASEEAEGSAEASPAGEVATVVVAVASAAGVGESTRQTGESEWGCIFGCRPAKKRL
tara:strand:- start:89 stop:373 length:285 start_codon:yes stop_codon:yes gene_type:complete